MRFPGERVVLRDHIPEDAEPMAGYHADPRFLEFYPPGLAAAVDAKTLVDLFITWADEQPRRNFQFAIIERETEQLIGSCGIRTAGMDPSWAEFGIELAPKSWGKGFAEESARLVIDFAFDTLHITRLVSVAITQNLPVAPLLKRLGFSERSARPGEEWMEQRGWTYTDWVLEMQRGKGRGQSADESLTRG